MPGLTYTEDGDMVCFDPIAIVKAILQLEIEVEHLQAAVLALGGALRASESDANAPDVWGQPS